MFGLVYNFPVRPQTQTMSTQTFSVIVEPRRWSRSTEELARTLAPLMGVSPPVLSSLLLRGPMTVEADLSHAAALSLCSRLVGAGVPASIQGAGDRTMSDDINVSDIESMLAAMGIDEIEVDDEIGPISSGGMSAQITKPLSDSDGEARVPVLSRRQDDTTQPDASGGWSSLFPDMETATTQPFEGEKEPPPDLFDLEGVGQARNHNPTQTEEDTSKWKMDRKRLLQDALRREALTATDAINGVEKPDLSSNLTSEVPLSDRRSVESILAPKEDNKPPYAPTGFDDRSPHVPGLAKVLSAFAPGAGQVYNGDDDAALGFATQAWKIKPWIASTRHAERRAARIQEYHLPWPEEGSLFRAIKFLLTFWFILGLLILLIFFVGRALVQLMDREPLPGITAEDLDFAYSNARGKVLEARIKSLDAVADAMQNSEKPRFTMSDKERSERLYRTGYQDCVSRRMDQCETIMRKVTAMDPSNRDAFRLQTWANSQRRTPDGTRMPDVGEVETLEEYELRNMQDEETDE